MKPGRATVALADLVHREVERVVECADRNHDTDRFVCGEGEPVHRGCISAHGDLFTVFAAYDFDAVLDAVDSTGHFHLRIGQRFTAFTCGFDGQCFFCNSGAEANEGALKLARLHTAPEKYKFITAEGSFYGRTFATLTATAQPQHHEGFLPLLPGFTYVPFNDIDALMEAFSDEVAAVMIEPIQGEGGVNMATPEYMQTIRQLCDEKEALMILDEVQTGVGRTGSWFGYQHYGIKPDIITIGIPGPGFTLPPAR